METIKQLVKDKELIVRKTTASFLEKIFRYFGHDFRHDIFKKVIYSETSIITQFEEKYKNYYDAYVYLLSNHRNPITKQLLMRFFYLMFGDDFDGYIICKLVNLYFTYGDLSGIELAIKYHMDVYKELKSYGEEDKLIISLMIFNFILLKNNIPSVKFTHKELKKYIEARNLYIQGNRISLYNIIFQILNNEEKFQDIKYYKNLEVINMKDIIDSFKRDEEYLRSQYKIKSILLYGSFASGDDRIDSDIDLLVSFSLDVCSKDKIEYINFIKKHYFNIFNRYIDITEI